MDLGGILLDIVFAILDPIALLIGAGTGVLYTKSKKAAIAVAFVLWALFNFSYHHNLFYPFKQAVVIAFWMWAASRIVGWRR